MKAPINNSEFLLEGDFQRFLEHNQVFDSMVDPAQVMRHE